jgi:hypothetical protein
VRRSEARLHFPSTITTPALLRPSSRFDSTIRPPCCGARPRRAAVDRPAFRPAHSLPFFRALKCTGSAKASRQRRPAGFLPSSMQTTSCLCTPKEKSTCLCWMQFASRFIAADCLLLRRQLSRARSPLLAYFTAGSSNAFTSNPSGAHVFTITFAIFAVVR